MAKSITKRTLRGFRQAKVNARYFEDLINKITNQPDLFIGKVTNGINYWKNNTLESDMKFNAIVGNPPYQVNVGVEKENFAIPIFGKFVSIAKHLSPQYVSMIMPSRWFTGGRGLDDFRKEMLNDERLSYIKDFIDSRECFPSVDIAGGICYLLWDKNHSGACLYETVHNGRTSSAYRQLNEYDIFIRRNDALSIIKKVLALHEPTLSQRVSTQTPFGFITTFRGRSSTFPGAITLIGSNNSITYVTKEEVTKNQAWIPKYKVIFNMASAEHAGTPDRNGFYGVLCNIKIINPNEVCSQTFLVGNTVDSMEEAINCSIYLRTKFVRYLVQQTMTSQHLGAEKFRFVPIQDWSKPWSDSELYKKYSLSAEEIDCIESMIKPMEGQERLFESEDLIDPNFGDFDLLECGVKVGDTIVYTPTGDNVVVLDGHRVEVNGEQLTLAQFTANYMPRNKRSVSGVCQGPRYFSYNGVSLYKLKESFLGGQKA